MARDKFDADYNKEKSIPMSEIGKHSGIVAVAENIGDEIFANELVEIEVHTSSVEGELDVIAPSVNGINQPIVRGRRTWVKRKYVEALANCRTTKYVQELLDPRDLGSLQMKEKTVLSYPFVVHTDKNPNGKEWLKGLLAT